jgi:hypothetical protein
LATRHVDQLYGSPHAKDRLRVFLETLRGTMTVVQGRELLGLSESQFHEARHRWLQEALELLEPRRRGRPPQEANPAEGAGERARLEAEVTRLRDQLQAAEVREEIARIVGHPAGEPGTKTAEPSPMPRKAR